MMDKRLTKTQLRAIHSKGDRIKRLKFIKKHTPERFDDAVKTGDLKLNKAEKQELGV